MIQPLEDRVLIRPLKAESKTPDQAKEKPQKGKVVAVGPGRMLKDGTRSLFDVSVGDVVIFPRYGGDQVKDGDTEYTIIPEGNLLAKVT